MPLCDCLHACHFFTLYFVVFALPTDTSYISSGLKRLPFHRTPFRRSCTACCCTHGDAFCVCVYRARCLLLLRLRCSAAARARWNTHAAHAHLTTTRAWQRAAAAAFACVSPRILRACLCRTPVLLRARACPWRTARRAPPAFPAAQAALERYVADTRSCNPFRSSRIFRAIMSLVYHHSPLLRCARTLYWPFAVWLCRRSSYDALWRGSAVLRCCVCLLIVPLAQFWLNAGGQTAFTTPRWFENRRALRYTVLNGMSVVSRLPQPYRLPALSGWILRGQLILDSRICYRHYARNTSCPSPYLCRLHRMVCCAFCLYTCPFTRLPASTNLFALQATSRTCHTLRVVLPFAAFYLPATNHILPAIFVGGIAFEGKISGGRTAVPVSCRRRRR